MPEEFRFRNSTLPETSAPKRSMVGRWISFLGWPIYGFRGRNLPRFLTLMVQEGNRKTWWFHFLLKLSLLGKIPILINTFQMGGSNQNHYHPGIRNEDVSGPSPHHLLNGLQPKHFKFFKVFFMLFFDLTEHEVYFSFKTCFLEMIYNVVEDHPDRSGRFEFVFFFIFCPW